NTRSAGPAPLQRRAAPHPRPSPRERRIARRGLSLPPSSASHVFTRAGTEVPRAVFHGNIPQSASRPAMPGGMSGSWVMTILKYVGTVGAAALLTTAVALPAAAQSANAVLHDKNGKDVGTVNLLQTPAGVLLKLTLKGIPAGEHAFHIHAAAKCEPPAFTSARTHFNPANEKHGMLSGHGHAGDMPNLHVPQNGELSVEVLNTAITLEKGKPNSLFHPDGTAIVIHEGVDDYKSDPAGNAGARFACGVIAAR